MYTIRIRAAWCKQCGICAAFCPKNVFEFDENGFPRPKGQDACIGCRLCEMRCPDFSIQVEEL